jgi:hypothetical protein
METSPWLFAIQAAGCVHLGIGAGNLLLPKALEYRKHLSAFDPLLAQIFLVHAGYIIGMVTVIGVICLMFPTELATTMLGRFLCGSFCLIWLVRIYLQFFFYGNAVLKKLPYLHWPFTVAIVAFTVLFAAVAAGIAA